MACLQVVTQMTLWPKKRYISRCVRLFLQRVFSFRMSAHVRLCVARDERSFVKKTNYTEHYVSKQLQHVFVSTHECRCVDRLLSWLTTSGFLDCFLGRLKKVMFTIADASVVWEPHARRRENIAKSWFRRVELSKKLKQAKGVPAHKPSWVYAWAAILLNLIKSWFRAVRKSTIRVSFKQ